MDESIGGPRGQEPGSGWSRRRLLQSAGVAGAVAATAVTGGPSASASASAARPPQDLSGTRPVLLRGGTVITMDRPGVLVGADVLVRAGRIEAVGQRLAAPPGTVELDVRGKLVQPGMIDTHRHMWQTSLRGIGADWTLTTYNDFVFERLGPLYTPEDAYAGSLLGALEAVENGVTTVVDWSHNMRTPQHGDAVLDALLASGVRARLAYGNYSVPPQQWVPRGDVERLREARFPAPDDRVTLQLAIDAFPGDGFAEAPAFAWARDRGFPVTTHAGVFGFQGDLPVTKLRDAGLLLPSTTYVHAAALSDESYRLIADSGGTVSVAAESEMQGGQGYPPTAALRRFGIGTSLSVDTTTWFNGDMFAAMRATLSADRGLAHLRSHERGEVLKANDLRVADVLGYATLGGARSLGLDRELGSLTPGKRADIVVLDTGSAGMSPVVNPIGTVVLHAGRGDVDTVLVGGRVLKTQGRLVDGSALDRARKLAEASRDRLRRAAGERTWNEALNPPRR